MGTGPVDLARTAPDGAGYAVALGVGPATDPVSAPAPRPVGHAVPSLT